MTWTKLPPLTEEQAGLRSGCLTCGPQPVAIHLDAQICVGFGYAGLQKDGLEVWAHEDMEDEPITIADAEKMALADPDHDWRAVYSGPLSAAEYQRHGDGQWLLVKKGMGFA